MLVPAGVQFRPVDLEGSQFQYGRYMEYGDEILRTDS